MKNVFFRKKLNLTDCWSVFLIFFKLILNILQNIKMTDGQSIIKYLTKEVFMSPRKINKDEKRREVAMACSDLIHDVGMKNITVAQVAKTAGIGKGTVYEYFDKKEDIIFEIINMHIENYHNEFLKSIEEVKSTKEKIFHFFRFVLDDSEENLRHFNGYKEYLSIVLADENSAMKEFNCSSNEFFKTQMEKIIQDGIDNGELIPQALSLSNGLLIFEKGLALLKMSENDYDVKADFDQFINAILELIKVKND